MSGSSAPDPPDGHGGLVVIIRDDPLTSARTLAQDLNAELAIGGEAVEAALDLVHPLPLDQAPDDMARLSAAMRRSEAVLERTRASAAVHLARSINTDLAIHPDTLHRAAHELRSASAALTRAAAGRAPAAARTAQRLRVAATGSIALVGLVIAALGAWPVGAGVIALAVAGGITARRSTLRAARTALPAMEAAEGVARRRWEQLAGAGADPADVEAVVHRYDPQHKIVADLLTHHPAVRAAARAASIHRSAWVRAWRNEVGEAAGPPEVADPIDVLEGWAPTPPPSKPAAAAATLVVAAPYGGLSDERAQLIHKRLLGLPRGPRVIVVLGPDSTADRAPVVDLTDPHSVVDLTAASSQTGVPTSDSAVQPVSAVPATRR